MSRSLSALVLLSLLFLPVSALASPPTQAGNTSGRAAAILRSMTPEEKVGQLFLVSFRGPAAPAESEIHTLVTRYHVGGVVLQARNDNFLPAPDTAAGVQQLTNSLQQAEYDFSSGAASTPAAPSVRGSPVYVPLLVAMAHEGDGVLSTGLMDAVTPLPNAMTIGATWDPSQSKAVGEIVGREMAALGVNMLLGPSLDVLETPNPSGTGDLGTRTFGGDSYWVGAMGKEYIAGVHAGSKDRVLVIAKNFPGQGGSDRRINDEIPTVRKSLAQLKLIELAPFFLVTGNASDPQAAADGLLVTHIRYQGFQGNIYDTTRPVSLDQQSLQNQLLTLPELAGWRSQGGVLVSESLGLRAVRRFIDPTEQTFPARLVARDALLAGNDLLQATDFTTPGSTEFATIVDTLSFFAQKYGEDEVFARRVDEAVERILNLKLKLYDEFEPDAVLVPDSELATLGQGRDRVSAIAARAATLIFPSLSDLDARLPDPPSRNDRIVFFTDTRTTSQCSACPAVPLLPVDALQQAVLRFYGPQASGQVNVGRLQSFSFSDLAAHLAAPGPTPVPDATATAPVDPLGEALNNSQWIVFSMLDVNPDVPASDVVRTFLSTRLDLARQKKVVVFAFNAPYYLDATEIGKLSAYYALYSRRQPLVDLAARLLFQEIRPAGASPVSVPGVGYDIVDATSPDPTQVIPICIGASDQPCEATTELPSVKVGDTLPLHTGTLLDHNGNPVPDNTPVTFVVKFVNETIPDLTLSASTKGAVASTTYPLDRTGLLEIRANSMSAQNSWTLQVNAQSDQATIISITPTPFPSPSPEPSATAPPALTPTAAASTATIGPVPTPRVTLSDFWLAVVGCLLFGSFGFFLGYRLAVKTPVRVRFALWGMVGTLSGYNYFVLGFPGASWIDVAFAGRSSVLMILIGGAVGVAGGWAWWKWGKYLDPGASSLRRESRYEGD